MTIFWNGQKTAPEDLRLTGAGQLVCFFSLEEAKAAPQETEFSALYREDLSQNDTTRFESRMGFDYLSVNIPDYDDIMDDTRRVEIYYAPQRLYFVCDDCLVATEALLRDIAAEREEPLSPGKVLFLFFSHLTEKDADRLDAIEEEIADLEDALVSKEVEDCTGKISALRKKLLALKRYYEGLFDLLEDLEENWNGLFTKGEIKALRIQTNRADRLAHAVLNLRDYVTQVREAYQNQLDISLNETMKLFTVITAVFLPLTLIAGWYGMNLRMPEFSASFAYPLVILFSIMVAAVCLLIFKKKKWF